MSGSRQAQGVQMPAEPPRGFWVAAVVALAGHLGPLAPRAATPDESGRTATHDESGRVDLMGSATGEPRGICPTCHGSGLIVIHGPGETLHEPCPTCQPTITKSAPSGERE